MADSDIDMGTLSSHNPIAMTCHGQEYAEFKAREGKWFKVSNIIQIHFD